jgi:prevent-host-death family protein
MRTVGAFEAKARLSRLLLEVEQGRAPVLIQRRGRNVAVLQAYEDYAQSARENDAESAVRSFRGIRERARPCQPGGPSVAELVQEGRKR